MLHQQQQSILSGVDNARQSGFAVGEDWSVTDAMFTPGSMGWYARQPTAQTISADLRTEAGAFAGQELQTATDMSGAAGELGGEGAVRGHIQAIGNHLFKTDGGKQPPPGPSPEEPIRPTDLGGLLGAPPQPNSIDQYQQAITAPPVPPSAAPPPMPASPPPRPPQMVAAPPPAPPPQLQPEANPTPGGLAAAVFGGCGTGALDGGLVGAPIPIAETVTIPGGCVGGALITGGMYLGGIWLDNMLNGNG